MYSLATVRSLVSLQSQDASLDGPTMDVLMVFGFLTALLTLLLWFHRGQSHSVVAAFAVCLAAMTVYTFLAGAWPMGIITAVWSGVTWRQWYAEKYSGNRIGTFRSKLNSRTHHWNTESRISRLFHQN